MSLSLETQPAPVSGDKVKVLRAAPAQGECRRVFELRMGLGGGAEGWESGSCSFLQEGTHLSLGP